MQLVFNISRLAVIVRRSFSGSSTLNCLSKTRLCNTMTAAGSTWTFGFGSNMNVDLVRDKKGFNVLDSTPAVVKGWKVAFNMQAMPMVEPSFACAIQAEKEEIHGVALLLPNSDVEALDKQEGAYIHATVTLKAYDGRELLGFLYTKPENMQGSSTPPKAELPCSYRYLRVLVDGAVSAGLDAGYIERLAARPTYQPSEETLQKRRNLPSPASLPPFTVDQLRQANSAGFEHTCILGYVLKLPQGAVIFKQQVGRDVTARQSRHWKGISMDMEDDGGCMPMQEAVADMPPDQLEYVRHWLDHYLNKDNCHVVGYLSEFLAQNPQTPL